MAVPINEESAQSLDKGAPPPSDSDGRSGSEVNGLISSLLGGVRKNF